MTKKKIYKPLPEYLSIGPSDIHGAGIIAKEDIPADIDMGITLCKVCHKKAHKDEGCRFTDMRKKVCVNE